MNDHNRRRNNREFDGLDDRHCDASHHKPFKRYQNDTSGHNSGHYFDDSSGRADDRPSKSKLMRFKALKEMIEKYERSPDDLLLQLKDNSFYDLLDDCETLAGKCDDYQFYCLVAKALAIVCHSSRDLLLGFISKVNETHFEIVTQKYLLDYCKYILNGCQTTRNLDLHLTAFEHLIQFVRQTQQMIPQSSRDKVSLVLMSLNKVVEWCNREGVSMGAIKATDIAIIKEIEDFNVKTSICFANGNVQTPHASQLPPNDFRSIPVYPTYDDIHANDKPFLRTNIVRGKYTDVDHYLDIHFRLLREDFVRPLREGIKDYLMAVRNQKFMKFKDIRVYYNVMILDQRFDRDGIIYKTSFAANNFRAVNWNVSKRLIYGSLLCLSYNNFQTVCFATVVGDRNVRELSKGIVWLQFIDDSQLDYRYKESLKKQFIGRNLVMIESQAYYEAYRHNLLALQGFSRQTFPLKDYLIDVSPNIKFLTHLNHSSLYNLTDAALPLNAANDNMLNDMDVDLIGRLIKVDVLNSDLWPQARDLSLDDSQYEAFKAGLTKQLAIIQGPPGTGKTYVGLRIVQTLLRNKHLWNNLNNDKNTEVWDFMENIFDERIVTNRFGERLTRNASFAHQNYSPILVVCYTNHALDQFLEGMLPFCKDKHKLVRIGGRSKSELLKPFTFAELRRAPRFRANRRLSNYVRKSRAELQSIQIKLSSFRTNIEELSNRFLNEDELETLIKTVSPHCSRLINQLIGLACDGNFDLALIDWLDRDIENVGHEFTVENLDLTDEYDMFEEDYAIVDEIRFITDMRMVEEEYNFCEERRNVNGDKYVTNLTKQQREKIEKLLQTEMKSEDLMSEKELMVVSNVCELTNENRWRLYRYLVQLYANEIKFKIEDLNQSYSYEMIYYNKLKKEEDICLLRECDIIGLTTTGAAKFRAIIERIDPYIVIVEEAAEVLESHVVTALTRSTNHLILIGDHQQLKPNPTVYELAKKYDLDVSMFERMIKNDMPYCQLKIQHRMRPEISALLVPHIYEHLKDHESVKLYPKIKGVGKSVFFLNHNQTENSLNDSTSKMNRFEAEFIVRLCKHLVQQSYKPSQITILTMYSAQLFEVKSFMREHESVLKGVCATVLDNYQGEENDIILLSFVRSNSEGNIGFLKVSNRVNVALSRAKMGMYCIGNFDLLAEQSELWKDIIKDLTASQSIGPALPLYCQNHSERILMVSKASDFNRSPDGGCGEPCDHILECGHVCTRKCHAYDADHKEFQCLKICNKIVCELQHKCKDNCHFPEECKPCPVLMTKLRQSCGHHIRLKCSENPEEKYCFEPIEKCLSCGHNSIMECSKDPSEVNCHTLCNKLLSCEHLCQDLCPFSDPCSPCSTLVEKLRPSCGHSFEMKCSVNPEEVFCSEKIERCLPCGHNLVMICSQNPLHAQCQQFFDKRLPCGHIKISKCFQKPSEIYCAKFCEKILSCGHKCNLRCGDKCDPKLCRLRIDILSECGHQIKIECSKQLDTDIQLKSCKQKCDTILECGHRCGGNCGDCFQKRFHVNCEAKCERRLICGHMCSAPCFMQCPPCYQKCQNICAHSRCDASCGQKCTPCTKRCVRRCDHNRCSRRCHEPCDRDYCSQPCAKTLKCKHQCIGLCGERCPNKCRICDKELFIGDEDEANARFIQLIDCGHVIELNAMIEWLSMSDNQNASQSKIEVKKCPKCETNIIRKTKLLNGLMRGFNNDMERVKQNLSGNYSENRKLQNELEAKIKTLNRNYFRQTSQTPNTLNGLICKTLNNISTQLKPSHRIQVKPKFVLLEFENKIEMITEVIELNKTLENAKTLLSRDRFAPLDNMLDQFKRRIAIFIHFIDSLFVNNTQQILDAKSELKYLFTVNSIINVLSNKYLINKEFQNTLIEAFDILNQLTPFTEEKNVNIKSLIDRALKLEGKWDFNFETNITILKASNFRAGYWLKCANNHIYCVTECGVGEEESCLQCKKADRNVETAARVLPANRLAAAIDGSNGTASSVRFQRFNSRPKNWWRFR